ncbi:MAG: 2-oxoacid:acceptor oxidoreductase subunit alpha [Candidatus Omnitrophica bacterium]|nr:2-oxoacid:acceptor oxidoreductase subunit alpha [Candidatus Omnitrophota bacterium]
MTPVSPEKNEAVNNAGPENAPVSKPKRTEKTLRTAIIRFAGDSGDGMQLTGDRFTDASAIMGNDISTLPDYPAEIRAPAGTLPGVSSFQVNIGSVATHTPGDRPQTLVAMNPAALKVHLPDVEEHGWVIVNTDAFTPGNLKKALWSANPLDGSTLKDYTVIKIPISTLTQKALQESKLSPSEVERCKNFYALGLIFWLYDRTPDSTLQWIEQKFSKKQDIAQANAAALRAGYSYADVTDLFPVRYQVKKAAIGPGVYRKISGNEALALGLVTAANLAGKDLFYGSYPITPASGILHELSKHKNFRVKTFQAEDEIAAMGAVIGASFGGHLGVTGTSGPGMCLKSEAIGLAIMVELPCVIIDVQRGGPSTGLPTKTEQADLLQAMFGRNGESPVAVVAPATPAECFDMAIEAVRIAFKFMTPVIILSDGYIANGAEPWKLPDVGKLPKIVVEHPKTGESFQPYERDPKTLAREWAIPGTPGLMHRIGGIEKANITGSVSYDPENHEKMCRLRTEKVARIADDIAPAEVIGPKKGKLLVVGWGNTYGPILTAIENLRAAGKAVSMCHLRYLNPFPKNFSEVFSQFEKILVPELNLGQFLFLLRGRFPKIRAEGFNKVQGQPFKVAEIESKIRELL